MASVYRYPSGNALLGDFENGPDRSAGLLWPVSLLPGGVILFYSYITEGKIGIGDGLLVMPAGLCAMAEMYGGNYRRLSAHLLFGGGITDKQKRKPKYPYPFCTVFSGSGGFGVDNGGVDRSSCG